MGAAAPCSCCLSRDAAGTIGRNDSEEVGQQEAARLLQEWANAIQHSQAVSKSGRPLQPPSAACPPQAGQAVPQGMRARAYTRAYSMPVNLLFDDVAQAREEAEAAERFKEPQKELERVIERLSGQARGTDGVGTNRDVHEVPEDSPDSSATQEELPTFRSKDGSETVPASSADVLPSQSTIQMPTGLNLISPYSHFSRIVTPSSADENKA
uniref:Uncharacterized protein n=1 Tax=Alexandrium monilatum TaxID=311494 RepID=A0A7S4RQS2_9DINO|mmetsp:Transcript_59738/g.187421  ORF Transcript_59738/g.187421 Transcript_59738/m.187421 type:complete len:211 (-) Transcript_59738:65-697(-)